MYSGISGLNQTGTGIVPSGTGRKKKDKARMSADQVLQMMKEAESRFIKPVPRKELKGALGITLFDVAQSLGVSHYDLKRRIERSGELEYLKAFGHQTTTTIVVPPTGPRAESYVLDVMAAQHIVAKYDNWAGRFYLDFLIRCKDALKVSLDKYQKLETELAKANKKIEKLTQPKISKTPKISTMRVVPAHNDHFHDGEFKLIPEVIQYPKKGETRYDEAYVQKVSKIANGNIKGMKKALKNMGCSSEVINKCLSVFEAVGKDFEGLINPKDEKEYAELKKRIEREFGS